MVAGRPTGFPPPPDPPQQGGGELRPGLHRHHRQAQGIERVRRHCCPPPGRCGAARPAPSPAASRWHARCGPGTRPPHPPAAHPGSAASAPPAAARAGEPGPRERPARRGAPPTGRPPPLPAPPPRPGCVAPPGAPPVISQLVAGHPYQPRHRHLRHPDAALPYGPTAAMNVSAVRSSATTVLPHRGSR